MFHKQAYRRAFLRLPLIGQVAELGDADAQEDIEFEHQYTYRFESCPDRQNIYMSNYWMNARRYDDGSKAITYFRKRKYMTSRNKYGKIRLTMWIAHHHKVEAAWYYNQGVEWTAAWKTAQFRNQ